VIFAVAYIVVEIGLKTPRNLISLGGMAALVTFTFICSYNPAAVKITLIGSFLLLFNVKLPGIFMIGSIRVQTINYVNRRWSNLCTYTFIPTMLRIDDMIGIYCQLPRNCGSLDSATCCLSVQTMRPFTSMKTMRWFKWSSERVRIVRL
jgi:hypothetical protein